MGRVLRKEVPLMHRFYAEQMDRETAFLSPEDQNHALRVLRLVPGDIVELMWQGNRFLGELQDSSSARVLRPLPSTEASLRITLFQGLPKADKMDWIVQKAVEIGVARIVPVLMERCITRLTPQDAEKKRVRWSRIAREAGKQSGRCLVPEVTLPVPLRALPELGREQDCCVVPWEEAGSVGPLGFVRDHPSFSSLGILIGPEGGIAPEEIESLKEVFCPVTLGQRILRTETAGLAAASAFLALRGEMEAPA